MASTTGSVGRLRVASASTARVTCHQAAKRPNNHLKVSRTGAISRWPSELPIPEQRLAFSSSNARVNSEERLARNQEQGNAKTESGQETKEFMPRESPEKKHGSDNLDGDKVGGAFTRRLQQLASDAIEASPRESIKAAAAIAATEKTSETTESNAGFSDAELGFDEGLKRELEDRIRGASLRATNPQAFAISELPRSAGRGTRDIAGSRAWTGEEAVEDTALRMLVDAHKPLKVPRSSGIGRSSSGVKAAPTGVHARVPTLRKPVVSTGSRLAEARDKSSAYSALKDNGMSKEEREAYSRELRARFQPQARELPATLTGLASLANERIEEAIARGQFKNLPRGKVLERDHNASSPFIDTTEYIMNNMIKKQDIVPPWIEKQQEMALAAARFRRRLRSEWTRHAARVIASKGGTLEEQMRRADEYAQAETLLEAREQNSSSVIGTVVPSDHFSGISPSGELSSLKSSPSEPMTEESSNDVLRNSDYSDQQRQQDQQVRRSQLDPFRDPSWEATELSFLKLSIDSLNSQTRTYNLIAPRPAQKPYFSLQRELKACYRDVAPLLASEIRQRALAPKRKPKEYKLGSGAPVGLIDSVARSKANVYDEDLDKKGYGLKQFWRDLWENGDKRI